jgi:hypothetical protein
VSQISKLYFGKDDAESDIAKGGLLRAGFLRTHAYDVALAGTKSLVIGRKGSGKSAICLTILNSMADEQRASLVSPDEISAEEIRRFQLPGIQPAQSKQLIWRYVFSIQISKYILNYAKIISVESEILKRDLSKLRKFLLDNNEVDDPSFVERFWKVIERLKGSVTLEAFGVKMGAGLEQQHPTPGIRANDHLDILERQLAELGKQLGLSDIDKPFYLLVDQIEKVWSNDVESDAMVVGLLQASKDIRSKLDWVKCTIFLRADIYEKLQFQDRDKFRGDEFHIDWDAKQLIDLIETRAAASEANINAKALWSGVFPNDVDGGDFKVFVIGRTLMRPRDVIQLCNAFRDAAATNGNSSIEKADVKQAISLYSSWKLSDLQNEWSVNYPFLPEVFVILADNSYLVTRSAFEQRFFHIKSDLGTRYPASAATTTSADAVLGILYAIGLLGVVRQNVTHYYYQDKTQKRIQVADSQFVIHPCFRNALQSTSALDMAPFEGLSEREGGLLRERFQSGIRIGQSFPSTRGSPFIRVLSFCERTLNEIQFNMAASTLPDEVAQEIRLDLCRVQRELRDASESAAADFAVRVAQDVSLHLRRLIKRVSEPLLIDTDSVSRMQSVVAELEQLLNRGDVDPYNA